MPLPLGQNIRAYEFTGITIMALKMGNVLYRVRTFYALSEVIEFSKDISILTINYTFLSLKMFFDNYEINFH